MSAPKDTKWSGWGPEPDGWPASDESKWEGWGPEPKRWSRVTKRLVRTTSAPNLTSVCEEDGSLQDPPCEDSDERSSRTPNLVETVEEEAAEMTVTPDRLNNSGSSSSVVPSTLKRASANRRPCLQFIHEPYQG